MVKVMEVGAMMQSNRPRYYSRRRLDILGNQILRTVNLWNGYNG